MKLQFILGRPGTGKTTYCYSEIAAMQEEKDDDSALILIVPEQFSFQSEKALLAATPRGAISRARVLSFNRLFYFVLSKTGGLGRATLENSGKNMVLRKIVGGLDKQLGYYKSAKDAKGFLDSLSTSITEFYHYDITPDTLEQKIRAADGALALKLTDLHLIYSNYKNFLEENFISSDEVLDILAEKIPKADFLQNACIWIDGFKSFTPQEARVLAALLRMAKQVKIALPSPKRLADFSEISKGGVNQEVVETMEKIQQMVLEAGAAFDEPQVLTHQHRHKNAPDIAFLCQNFLSIRNVKFADVPQNIRIAPAENIFDEIDAAARLVTTLTRDRGYKYSEIGIIATNLAEYEKFVPAMFARYHIPVFVDARRGILSHPLVDLVFAACQVIYTNWNYESVFRMLRLPIFDCREEIDILENYVLAYNIRGKTTWQKDFAYGDEDELAALNPLRQRVYDVLAPLHEKFTPRRKYILKNFATAIYNFLIQIDAPATLESWMDEAMLGGDNEALREHEQIWPALMGTLDKMCEILPEQTENINGFAKILEAGLPDLGLAPPSLDQLVLGDLRRSRFGEIKAMLILGARDGAMPSRPNDSGLLSDLDRYTLEQDGLKLAKDTTAQLFEEEFLIYTNFSKPSEFLSVSYPTGELSGRAHSPARLLGRVRDLFPQLDNIPTDPLAHITSPHAVFSDMLLEINDTPAHPSVYGFFAQDEAFGKRMAHIKEGLGYEGLEQKLTAVSVKSLYNPHVYTSVSKLGRYIACPFSYFAQYNLRLKRRKIHELAAVDFGNIYHDILAKFGTILEELGPKGVADTPRVTELVGKAIDEVLQSESNHQLNSTGKYMHFAAKMRAISQNSALALANHLASGDFSVAYNEVAFGRGDSGGEFSLPPIEIELTENAKMLLEGRIDRVDIAAIDGTEYVKIIDYKSGRKQFSLEEVRHGLDMQLLIYLGAFIEKLATARGQNAAKAILPAAAFYFNLLNPLLDFDPKLEDSAHYAKKLMDAFKMSGLVLENDDVISAIQGDLSTFKGKNAAINAETFASLMQHVKNIAKQAGNAMLKGDIAISPYAHKGQAPCTYCDYHTICKFDKANQAGYRHL